jgi:putative phage-type endonuclease
MENQPFVAIPDIEQGSSFWIEWRMSVIGSSEAAAIMGENPWKSRHDLFQEKTGKIAPFSGNFHTRRGTRLEPLARDLFEKKFGFSVPPAVLQSSIRPWQAASVDGIDFKRKIVVEIKCGKRAYEYTASTGRVPDYNFGQLQHILSVTGFEWIEYVSYSPESQPIFLKIRRDENYIARMLIHEEIFKNDLAAAGFALRKSIFELSTKNSGNTDPSFLNATKSLDGHNESLSNTNLGAGSPATSVHGIYLTSGVKYDGGWRNEQPNGKGSCTWPSGNRYEGDWVNGKRSGNGIFTWPNGSVYEGEFKEDLRSGKGTYAWPNGERYEGDWIDGKLVGKGRYVWPNGSVYEGEFKDGMRSGSGVYTWENGDRYEGDWVDGKRTGKGIFFCSKGERYEGDYKDGVECGKGIKSWPNGDRYEGDWVDGKKNGKGISIWADGRRYEGDHKNGIQFGKGLQIWPNGDRYEGEWVDGKPTGRGVFRWIDGRRYEGHYKDGVQHGKGIQHWSNGDRYEGDWLNGKQTGKGIFTWPDGRRYEGDYKDGVQCGKGIYTWPDGDRYEGDWISNQFTGHGVFTWASGDIYEGDWVDSQLEGQGVFTWATGDRYEGGWVDNQFSGLGVFTLIGGDEYSGSFLHDGLTGAGTYRWSNGDFFSGNLIDARPEGWGRLVLSSGLAYMGIWIAGIPFDLETSSRTDRSLKRKLMSCVENLKKIEAEIKKIENSKRPRFLATSIDRYDKKICKIEWDLEEILGLFSSEERNPVFLRLDECSDEDRINSIYEPSINKTAISVDSFRIEVLHLLREKSEVFEADYGVSPWEY